MSKSSFLSVELSNSTIDSLEAYLPQSIKDLAFDLDPNVAKNASREYGFARFYTDVEEMLSTEDLDGCISITPIPVTAGVAKQVIAAGVPILMEKPPGNTEEEVSEICELTSAPGVRAMVSMNRRFEPTVSAACSWRGDRPVEYARAVMLRHNRKEKGFFADTAIHSLDAIRHIAGDIGSYSANARQVDGVRWYSVRLEFESGALGALEVMPNCGAHAEYYEMLGAGYRVRASVGEADSGEYTAWENGEPVRHDEPTRGMPAFVKNGTFAETVEFINALKENRVPCPTPAEVRQSVDICREIQYETG